MKTSTLIELALGAGVWLLNRAGQSQAPAAAPGSMLSNVIAQANPGPAGPLTSPPVQTVTPYQAAAQAVSAPSVAPSTVVLAASTPAKPVIPPPPPQPVLYLLKAELDGRILLNAWDDNYPLSMYKNSQVSNDNMNAITKYNGQITAYNLRYGTFIPPILPVPGLTVISFF